MMAWDSWDQASRWFVIASRRTPFIAFSFQPRIGYCRRTLSWLWLLVIIIGFISFISQSREYVVQMSSRKYVVQMSSRAAVSSCVSDRLLRCFDVGARIDVNNANWILNISAAVYLLCNVTGINGRVRWLQLQHSSDSWLIAHAIQCKLISVKCSLT